MLRYDVLLNDGVRVFQVEDIQPSVRLSLLWLLLGSPCLDPWSLATLSWLVRRLHAMLFPVEAIRFTRLFDRDKTVSLILSLLYTNSSDCVTSFSFFRVRVRLHSTQLEALPQIRSYSDPSISCTTGSTTGALAPIALFCFTSSFKNTMFVRICIFYRSLSLMEQYDRQSC